MQAGTTLRLAASIVSRYFASGVRRPKRLPRIARVVSRGVMRRRAWCTLSGLLLFSCHAGVPPRPALPSLARGRNLPLRHASLPANSVTPRDPSCSTQTSSPSTSRTSRRSRRLSGRPVLVCMPLNEALGGRVLDEGTRAPIAGAVITVNAWESLAPTDTLHEPRSPIYSQQVTADAQGSWSWRALRCGWVGCWSVVACRS